MKRREPIIITDEEILQFQNVPVGIAAAAIGWSTPTMYIALQENRAPFGFAVKNEKTNSWTYNVSPAGLIKYRKGELQTLSLPGLKEMWADVANQVVSAKLQGVEALVAAVATVAARP